MKTCRILIGNIYRCTDCEKRIKEVDTDFGPGDVIYPYFEYEIVKENAVLIARLDGKYEDVEDSSAVMTSGPKHQDQIFVQPKEMCTYNELMKNKKEFISTLRLGFEISELKKRAAGDYGNIEVVDNEIRITLDGLVMVMSNNPENMQKAIALTSNLEGVTIYQKLANAIDDVAIRFVIAPLVNWRNEQLAKKMYGEDYKKICRKRGGK